MFTSFIYRKFISRCNRYDWPNPYKHHHSHTFLAKSGLTSVFKFELIFPKCHGSLRRSTQIYLNLDKIIYGNSLSLVVSPLSSQKGNFFSFSLLCLLEMLSLRWTPARYTTRREVGRFGKINSTLRSTNIRTQHTEFLSSLLGPKLLNFWVQILTGVSKKARLLSDQFLWVQLKLSF